MVRLRELAGVSVLAFAAMGAAMAVQAWSGPPRATAVPSKPVHVAHAAPTAPQVAPRITPMPRPVFVAAKVAPVTLAEDQALPKRALPKSAKAEAPLPPQNLALDPALANAMAKGVAARVRAKVPADLVPYFNVYLYVSKAASGPWAQHMFVFHKADDGTLAFEETFPVSTGREQQEQYFTKSPTGLFELDPNRFVRSARSAKWNGASMPWAMFLNYSYRTQMTGVALHGAVGREIPHLGHRASGGCVRMPLDKVEAMFHRLKNTEQGRVPVFTFDEARGTTNVEGRIRRDSSGNPILADGIRALVIIDAYPGDVPPEVPQT